MSYHDIHARYIFKYDLNIFSKFSNYKISFIRILKYVPCFIAYINISVYRYYCFIIIIIINISHYYVNENKLSTVFL